MRSRKCLKLHELLRGKRSRLFDSAPQVVMGPPAGGKGGFGGRGQGSPKPQDDSWGHHDFLDLPRTNLGLIQNEFLFGDPKKIKEVFEIYEFLDWRFRTQILEFTTNSWPIIQGGTDEEALELWRDIAHHLEFDARTWDSFMFLAHQGPAGRAEANKILWDVLTNICLLDHTNLNHKMATLIGKARRVIDRPPKDHSDRKDWTYLRAIEPRAAIKQFAAQSVPEKPVIITGAGGVPLAPPYCWFGMDGVHQKVEGPWDPTENLKNNGEDNRASRRSKSTKARVGLRPPRVKKVRFA